MITGELKNKIDGLWDIFAAGGLVNPLDVIEQITYLMFIHDLDKTDNIKAKESAMLGLPFTSIFTEEVEIGDRKIDGEQLKWSVFHDFPAGQMYSIMGEWVFPFIKNLHGEKDSTYSKYMDDAIFKIPTPLLLSKIVAELDEIYAQMEKMHDTDINGDVYEYLLSKIASAGLNGQFRTPRHIIKMMVELMDPKPTDIICDPACGTSGFLVASGEYLKENKKEEVFFNKANKDHYMNDMFHGFDMDRTMLRIGAMNMMTHGVDNPFIEYRDSLSDQNPDKEKYSLVLANPPFKGSLDSDTVSADLLKVCKTKKTELLFLALMLRMLKVGGRCAVIVPDGVLFGSSKAHKDIRREIVDNHRLEAVISMPSGVFKPYAGVSTGILIFTKTNHGGTDNVWFYDMTADGFSLDDKRNAVAENDIPNIIEKWRKLPSQSATLTALPECPLSHCVTALPERPLSHCVTALPECPLSHCVTALPEGEPGSTFFASPLGRGGDEVDGEGDKEGERTEKSFFVPKDEIIENGYDLSINKYKKTVYVAETYPPTSEIIAEIKALEDEILKGISELEVSYE